MKVLVTGSSRGIGKAIYDLLKQKGYDVIGCSRSSGIDVSKSEDVKKLPKDIDILINNAGIALYKQIQDTTEEEWDNIFSTNCKGMFLVTNHILPYMLQQKKGLIINLASIWGEVGGACEVAYSASKGAVIAYSKALAKELEPSGICVKYIYPGAVNTDMLKENPYGEVKGIEPEEVAEEILEIIESKTLYKGE